MNQNGLLVLLERRGNDLAHRPRRKCRLDNDQTSPRGSRRDRSAGVQELARVRLSRGVDWRVYGDHKHVARSNVLDVRRRAKATYLKTSLQKSIKPRLTDRYRQDALIQSFDSANLRIETGNVEPGCG
jgi:hypothetical protein